MFLDSLYKITTREELGESISFHLLVDSSHPLYEGHFPGNPITPGVVLGEIVKELLEVLAGQKVKMTTMRQSKFLAAHNPVESPNLEILIKLSGEEGYAVQAKGKSGDMVFFTLSANYVAL